MCIQLQGSVNSRDSRDLGFATAASDVCSSVSYRLPVDSTKPVPERLKKDPREDFVWMGSLGSILGLQG